MAASFSASNILLRVSDNRASDILGVLNAWARTKGVYQWTAGGSCNTCGPPTIKRGGCTSGTQGPQHETGH